MPYEDLIRKAWKSGDFSIAEAEPGPLLSESPATRVEIKKELQDVIAREAADASACLAAHKEGVMKLAPFVKFREEKFGAVLFETRSEKVYTLSPTGAAVVREIVAGKDAKSLIGRLKERYEDADGNLEKEASGFLNDLKAKQLVVE